MHLKRIALIVLVAGIVGLSACERQVSHGGPEPAVLQQASNAGWAKFGPSQRLAGTQLTLADATTAAEDVIISGRITEVCQHKGCWMTVSDGERELLVRFKNYSFFVPRNAAGRECTFRGDVEVQPISVEALRRQAEAAGASDAEIAAITEPGERILFIADAVYLEPVGLDEPYRPGDELADHDCDHAHDDSECDHAHDDGECDHAHHDGTCDHAHHDGDCDHVHDGECGHSDCADTCDQGQKCKHEHDGDCDHAHDDGKCDHAHHDGECDHAHHDGACDHDHKGEAAGSSAGEQKKGCGDCDGCPGKTGQEGAETTGQ